MKPLRPEILEVLNRFALEDLAAKRRFEDGTWNNLVGGSDAAFIVNYINDVTIAYRNYQTNRNDQIGSPASSSDRAFNRVPNNSIGCHEGSGSQGPKRERRYLQL